MDGAVVGAGSLWPTPIRELDSGVPLLATTGDGDFCIAVHFFPFDQLFRVCLMVLLLLC